MVYQARFGDKVALGTIIEAYYDDVYQFLARRHGDAFAAQDITQNAFLKFSQSLSDYREQGKLRSYIFTLAINCSNDYFKIAASREIPTEDEQFDGIMANDDEAIKIFEKREIVRKAVLSLERGRRDVVILRYYHDMKHSEIAEILGIPTATVKTRLFRAKRELSEKLKGEF